MADCPSCGSILKYDIPSGKVTCTSCGSAFRPEEVDSTQNAQEQNLMGVMEFLCPNCGGEIFSTDRDITGICSYCGSHAVFESRLVQKRRPDLIIPFQKTKEDCKQIYLRQLQKALFVPKELKEEQYIDSFRGIYMPYWLSEVTQKGNIRYYASDTKKHGDLHLHDTYRIKGSLTAAYHGLYHDAGTSFSDDISEKLEPYYLEDLKEAKGSNAKPFYPSYLSGFYAEPADVEFSDYQQYFHDIANRQTQDFLAGHEALKGARVDSVPYRDYQKLDLIDYREVVDEFIAIDKLVGAKGSTAKKQLKEQIYLSDKRSSQLDHDYREQIEKKGLVKPDTEDNSQRYGYEETQKETLAMFPVWFLSWRNNNRVAYMTVNGQTGRVCADLPIDLKRFFLIFAGIFAVLFAFFSLFTVSSYAMPVYAVFFSGLSIHMAYHELLMIKEHAQEAIIHNKRGTRFGSKETGLWGMVFLLLIIGIGSLMHRIIGSDIDFYWSHEGFCIYTSMFLLYTIWFLVKALRTWNSLKDTEKVVPSFLVSAAAAVFASVLVYRNIPDDLLLYGGAAIAFAGIVITMLGMILQFNKVATRPLPQFEHKGGDDRA